MCHFFVFPRNEFDLKADKLQQCLRSLDCRVTMSIIADMCTVFSDVDTPLHNVVTAATIPLPVSSNVQCSSALSLLREFRKSLQNWYRSRIWKYFSFQNDSLLNYNQAMSRLKQSHQAFLGYSERLCQAASNASSVAAEPHRKWIDMLFCHHSRLSDQCQTGFGPRPYAFFVVFPVNTSLCLVEVKFDVSCKDNYFKMVDQKQLLHFFCERAFRH